MYALTINDRIMLGPIEWNSGMFNYAVEEEVGLNPNLSISMKQNVPLDLGNGIKLRRAVEVRPSLNPKTQQHNGPTWSFTESLATATYTVGDKDIGQVKQALIDQVAANRYTKEVAGTTTTIQSTLVTVDTMRGARDVFVQKYLLMGEGDTVMWKFPEGWLLLTKADLGTVVNAGVQHVEQMFVWEALKIQEINAATTLSTLDSIELM